jgi:hypothetical protein
MSAGGAFCRKFSAASIFLVSCSLSLTTGKTRGSTTSWFASYECTRCRKRLVAFDELLSGLLCAGMVIVTAWTRLPSQSILILYLVSSPIYRSYNIYCVCLMLYICCINICFGVDCYSVSVRHSSLPVPRLETAGLPTTSRTLQILMSFQRFSTAGGRRRTNEGTVFHVFSWSAEDTIHSCPRLPLI